MKTTIVDLVEQLRTRHDLYEIAASANPQRLTRLVVNRDQDGRWVATLFYCRRRLTWRLRRRWKMLDVVAVVEPSRRAAIEAVYRLVAGREAEFGLRPERSS